MPSFSASTKPAPTPELREPDDDTRGIDEEELSRLAAQPYDFESDVETTDALSPVHAVTMTLPSTSPTPDYEAELHDMTMADDYTAISAAECPPVPTLGPYARTGKSQPMQPSIDVNELLPLPPGATLIETSQPIVCLETFALLEHFGLKEGELAPIAWTQSKVRNWQ